MYEVEVTRKERKEEEVSNHRSLLELLRSGFGGVEVAARRCLSAPGPSILSWTASIHSSFSLL